MRVLAGGVLLLRITGSCGTFHIVLGAGRCWPGRWIRWSRVVAGRWWRLGAATLLTGCIGDRPLMLCLSSENCSQCAGQG